MKNKLIIKKVNLKKISKKQFEIVKAALPDLNVKKWTWEYLDSDKVGYSFIAEINGTYVAHNSFIVSQFVIHNKKVLVAKSEGSYANLELIRKITGTNLRVFREVVKSAIKTMKKEKVFLAYGFPNKLGHKSYLYGGYSVKKINLYTSSLILRYDYHFYKKNNKTSFFKKVFLKVLNFFWKQLIVMPLLFFCVRKKNNIVLIKEEQFEDIKKLFLIIKKSAPSHYLMINRNEKYLSWRYLKNPYFKYLIYGYYKEEKLVGYVVFNKINEKNFKNIEIKDILYLDKTIFNELLGFVFKWGVANNISVVTLWEDAYEIKKTNSSILIKNGFFRCRNLIKKTFILNLLNAKIKDNSLVFELKKFLERK